MNLAAADALAPPRALARAPRPGPVLLYDGACGLCTRSVQWVLERDAPSRRRAPVRFAPLQGSTAGPVLERHRLAPGPEGFDTAVLVHDLGGAGERVLLRSDAIVGLLRHLGGRWRLLAVAAQLVPRPLREAAYRLVSRNRLRLGGAADVCRRPRRDERARFLP